LLDGPLQAEPADPTEVIDRLAATKKGLVATPSGRFGFVIGALASTP
jgi:hypothetical protein